MQFVCLLEFNHETEHTNMTFLQYTKNEEILKRLKNLIDYADYTENFFGECSQFEMSISMYDERTVSQMAMLKSYFISVSVCIGHFYFPDEEFEILDEVDTAFKLDDLFHSNQIDNYFK